MDTTLIIVIAIGAISIICLFAILLSSRTQSNPSAEFSPALSRREPPSKQPNVRREGVSPQPVPAAKRSDTKKDPKERLRERLVQAGLYKRNSKSFFYFLQFIFVAIPFVIGFVAYTFGLVSIRQAGVLAAITGIGGIITPGLWLDYRKSARQVKLRRALPDALDVLTVCVEAGLSLTAAIVHVSKELVTAHPMLANEMMIVHREIQMGMTTGKALKNLAQRFDVEELRSLASVIEQSERFGASVSAALKVYAESLRIRRMQKAQSRAQKAAVKLLFPTVLCIFPALLVVILGPAAFEIFQTMRDVTN